MKESRKFTRVDWVSVKDLPSNYFYSGMAGIIDFLLVCDEGNGPYIDIGRPRKVGLNIVTHIAPLPEFPE